MAVYVDDMRAPYGRMIMCHMTADSRDELDAMAKKLGISLKWIQYAGTSREHYDICLSKRAAAVAYGAQEITWRETALRCRGKRAAMAEGESA